MWGALLGTLIVAAIWTAILVALSQGLSGTRRAYVFGVGSAASAYVVAIVVYNSVGALVPTTPGWVGTIILAPVIEEAARLVGADTAYRRTTWRHWALFGIGYALFESGLKLSDGIVIAATSGFDQWYRILTPFIPFVMHVFLSMLMCLLLQRGLNLLGAYLVSVGLHAAHNGGVLSLSVSSVPTLLTVLFLQFWFYLALIRAVIWFAQRPRANSVESAG